jgi:hypothetical protein
MRFAMKVIFFMMALNVATGLIMLVNPVTGEYVLPLAQSMVIPQNTTLPSSDLNSTLDLDGSLQTLMKPGSLDFLGIGIAIKALSMLWSIISTFVFGFYNMITAIAAFIVPASSMFIVNFIAGAFQAVFVILVIVMAIEIVSGREILGMD